MRYFVGRERRKYQTHGDSTRFLESVEIYRIDLEAAGRRYLQAASALIALFKMKMHLAGRVFVFDNRFVRTDRRNALASGRIGAFIAEPVTIVVHGVVHRTACLAEHAAQCQILKGRTK